MPVISALGSPSRRQESFSATSESCVGGAPEKRGKVNNAATNGCSTESESRTGPRGKQSTVHERRNRGREWKWGIGWGKATSLVFCLQERKQSGPSYFPEFNGPQAIENTGASLGMRADGTGEQKPTVRQGNFCVATDRLAAENRNHPDCGARRQSGPFDRLPATEPLAGSERP